MAQIKIIYLTLEEKRKLSLNGDNVPICMNDSEKTFIAKIRSSLFDGSLKNKRIKL